MNELGYPIQSCDISGSIDVYYADDVIFLLDEKDNRIAELEKSGNEMAIIIAELRSEVLVLKHQVKRYKKGQGE